jgi:hypothetical protein
VPADVIESAQVSVAAAHEQQRFAQQFGGEKIIAGICDLDSMTLVNGLHPNIGGRAASRGGQCRPRLEMCLSKYPFCALDLRGTILRGRLKAHGKDRARQGAPNGKADEFGEQSRIACKSELGPRSKYGASAVPD